MAQRKSIKSTARDALRRDEALRKRATKDGFQNFAANLGLGTDNVMSGSTYGFNPITRVRTLLEWIHRGSWLGGQAVDVVADDMTRAGVELEGDGLDPDTIGKLDSEAVRLGVWGALNDNVKWSRLYGGSLAVHLVEGQDMSTPFRPETVGKGQYKGLMVLDRWMVESSLQDLVQELGPQLGLPKYYTVNTDAPALFGQRIHHTRCVRLEGIHLPYWQAVMENLWGISVLERLYDRMVAFDSATMGAAQLVYKAFIRKFKVKGYKQAVAAGGMAETGLFKYVDMMRRFQSVEGVAIMDADDDLEALQHSAFGGLSDVLLQLAQQVSGALQIPLTRLLGQSPGGLNSTGESDMRNYYDGIKQRQEKDLKVPVCTIYRCMALSLGIKLPEGFDCEFRSLWQLDEVQKSEVAERDGRTIGDLEERGVISQQTALKELRKTAKVTGRFHSIGDEEINAASELTAPSAELKLSSEPRENDLTYGGESDQTQDGAAKRFLDSPSSRFHHRHGLDIVVENPAGSIRRGGAGALSWAVPMPNDYGYIRGFVGADGDQIDAFVGPDEKSDKVYVVDQRDLGTGGFDESKCLLGFASQEAAMDCFHSAYRDGRAGERVGAVREFATVCDFVDWLNGGELKRPASADFRPLLRAVR